jgi:hypothetical protein
MLMLIPLSMERARSSLAIERLIEPREYLTVPLAIIFKHKPKKLHYPACSNTKLLWPYKTCVASALTALLTGSSEVVRGGASTQRLR